MFSFSCSYLIKNRIFVLSVFATPRFSSDGWTSDQWEISIDHVIDIKGWYQHVRPREEKEVEEAEDLHKTDEILDNFVRFVRTIRIEENILEARTNRHTWEGELVNAASCAEKCDNSCQMFSRPFFRFPEKTSRPHQLRKYLLIEQVYSPDCSHLHLLTNDFLHHLPYQIC